MYLFYFIFFENSIFLKLSGHSVRESFSSSRILLLETLIEVLSSGSSIENETFIKDLPISAMIDWFFQYR